MACHLNPEWLNIDSVVQNDLCTQCGACVAMCPHDNIVIERDVPVGLDRDVDVVLQHRERARVLAGPPVVEGDLVEPGETRRFTCDEVHAAELQRAPVSASSDEPAK